MIRNLLLLLAALPIPALPAAEDVALTRTDDRVRIEVAGQLFTEYRFKGVRKPYFYPVLAADGTPLTVDGEGEFDPHHHSLWFTHGEVNGVIFWNERDDTRGTIVTEALEHSAARGVGEIRTRRRWEGPGGAVFLTDDSVIRIRSDGDARLLDYEVTLRAPRDRPVVFGDTKEGSMAIRFARWMTPTHKIPNRKIDHQGQGVIVNAEGVRDDATWGKRSPWVDYHAPKGGKTYGVAMFDHPANPRHPTWWHVRTYGLFAANPFGQHDFEARKDQPQLGDLTIPAGGTATFRWRLYFHYGDERQAKVAERFRAYAAEK